MNQKIDVSQLELDDSVVAIKRVTKVVKGGRNMRFSALIVVGDHNGHVGAGIGKAAEIPEAIRKAKEDAIKKLVLNLGYSHPVEMEDPEGLETKVEENKIIVSGIDKEKVGQYAAEIRSTRAPEPYKGKGIKYDYEVIRRKVGKTGKK